MNVRITPRGHPLRTDLYTGVLTLRADEGRLIIKTRHDDQSLPLSTVAEIALDEHPGDYW